MDGEIGEEGKAVFDEACALIDLLVESLENMLRKYGIVGYKQIGLELFSL